MKDYIKLFKTAKDYFEGKDSLPTPNVSLIEDTMKVKLSSYGSVVEFVDLGLPSGTLWATCNLGASSPEETGLYFSWGNVIGHAGNEGYNFDLTTYNSTSGKSLTGNIPANSTYDAAVAMKNEPWQMPTKEQFVELFNENYTTWRWTKINGMSGYQVTSKTNNRSVFFPASGGCLGSSQSYVGSDGYYWSASFGDESSAYGLSFGSDDVGPLYGSGRCNGFTVRPVQNPS